MGMTFTDEQREVIASRGQNLLVSAAAGSGKTAVLVERILQRITGDDAVDIDRLLVVTFTRAAAAEMKERIGNALREALRTDPGNARLARQELLLHGAMITTIHSFCQSVLRSHYDENGPDPTARVADEGEIRLMEQETMDELFSECYEEADPDFLHTAEYFSPGPNDARAAEAVLTLYRFAVNMADPPAWLSEQGKACEDLGTVHELRRELTLRMLKDAEATLNTALVLSEKPDGPDVYAETLEGDLEEIERAIEGVEGADSPDDCVEALNAVRFATLKAARGFSGSQELKETVKELRDRVKETFKTHKESFYLRSAEEEQRACEDTVRAVRGLTRLTAMFMERLNARKRADNVIDFGDMEHLALALLESGAAPAYRSFFEEIMVDEYQDVSDVQERILALVARTDEASGYDRFMVGDVKQSIYRFRGASPEIFAGKLGAYTKEKEAPERRIDLHRNFRSREEVLSFVNACFTKLMAGDLGGVDYDDDAKLVCGASFPDDPAATEEYGTELMLLDEEECGDRDIAEATAVAEKIRRLMGSLRVSDGNGGLREVRYSDIVILMRAPGGRDETWRKVLEEAAIPAYVESREGYFNAPEVSAVMALLRILNNPLEDIPLVSVLHSPMYSFTDEELARIKTGDPEDHRRGAFFFEILQAFAEGGPEEEAALREKVTNFLVQFDDFRSRTAYMPTQELIRFLLTKTGYDAYVTALPAGTRRKANLELLLQRAADYEKTSFRGLFHFVRYIEQLRNYDVDYGEANVLDENADVVRIMSIHKSKGLEFPVVFVAGCGRKFNLSDASGDLLADRELGLGVNRILPELRVKTDTLRHNLIADKIKCDLLGEELRVLYVAMTRAKEKLILTGTVKEPVTALNHAALEHIDEATGRLSYTLRRRAMRYLDWVLPAMPKETKVTVLTGEDIEAAVLQSATEDMMRLEVLKNLPKEPADPGLRSTLGERFAKGYAHPEYAALYTKTTVTELKEALYREEGDARESRELLSTMPVDAALRGTLYHKAMEWMEAGFFDSAFISREDGEASRALTDFMLGMEMKGVAPSGFSKIVDAGDLLAFLRSGLGQRMGRALREGSLYRERQFMLGIDAREADPSLPDGEMLLIQGVIDAFFVEDGEIVLLDYKTDRGADEKTLSDRYRVQLDYYARAVTQITGMRVKESLIYAFALGKEIKLNQQPLQ